MVSANPLQYWIENLAQRPEIFPHQLNLINDQLLLVELTADEIDAASFLDQRVLAHNPKGAWVDWQAVADVFAGTETAHPASFVFHVGHCGSTLLSRLLQFGEEVQSLREPLPLRTLAQELADSGDGRSFLTENSLQERLRILSRMWCRGSTHTVVKATSICTDLLPSISTCDPRCRFLFVYNTAETHVATLLAGQNAMADLKGFAKLRLQRLQQKANLDIRLSELSPEKLAALSWLSECTSMVESGALHSDATETLNFEALIADPAGVLERVFRFLEITADEACIDAAIQSPVLKTYSKAPEVQYDAQTRATILADARSRFGPEIGKAMEWLHTLASDSELVAASLERFSPVEIAGR